MIEKKKDKIFNKYIIGKPEEILSKLAVEPVLRTYILSLVAANFVKTKKQIMEFFGETFWAHQYKDMYRLEAIIEKMLALLEDFEFIISSKEEFTSADELEDIKYRATKLGKRVAELYIDPLTAHDFIIALRRASDTYLLPISFLHMVSYTAKLRPLLRVKMREYDDIQEEFAKYEDHLLYREPSAFEPEYDEFMNSVKTALSSS